jgi:hypothetical protein
MTAQLTQVWTVLEDVTTGTLPLFSSPSHAKKRPHRLTIRPSRISSTIPTTPRTPPTPNQKMSVSFVLIAQTPTFVSVKHERCDGLTEWRATPLCAVSCCGLPLRCPSGPVTMHETISIMKSWFSPDPAIWDGLGERKEGMFGTRKRACDSTS